MFSKSMYIQHVGSRADRVVPTFSESGWVSGVVESLDFAMAHVFCSNQSQSTLFKDQVVSMASIYQKFGNQPTLLVEHMQQRLLIYLKSYFDEVTVQVKHTHSQEGSGMYDVHCFASVNVNGQEYTAASAVTIKDSRLLKYFKLSNTGTTLS